jgi:hypothetical protein
MDTAKECRDHAEECLAWARDAGSEQERDTFLKMAEDWLRAAALIEAGTTFAANEVRESLSLSS